MIIHKEGYGVLIVTFLVLAVIVGIIWLSFGITFITSAIAIVFAAFFFFISYFFRVPKRVALIDESSVISAADGKVVIIKEVEEDEFLHCRCRQVSVFMGICNVHINYYPVGGKVLYFKHHWGNYLVAWHPKSSVKNERTSVAIETAGGKKIFLRQIAGYVARRIVCYAKENEHANQCEQMGFIKFGSRLDLFLPLDAEIKVKVGDRVTACQSVIAKL
ncbi:MAG: phosphatidylserine decarboxylase family protein [Bacteroidales bacterium]|jgi:phosphatidylserine decarboxylase|nr:phosphatidylserine decarboxylase family protein [Bacteroidales bacterium]MCI1733321.1 phosphatidylserine decarboxylase family protein [Bacteroidales bacterium]